jgi:U3 small nucleolar RNA-associated protein 13
VDQNLVFHRLPNVTPFRHIVGYNDEVIDTLYLSPPSGNSDLSQDTHLAVATNSDLIRIYNLQRFDTTLLAGHLDVVLCLARNKDGTILMSGSKDRSARIWKQNSEGAWSCIGVCEGHLESVGAVAVAPREGQYIVTASQDRTVKIWDMKSLEEADQGDEPAKARSLTTLKVHDKDINAIDISPNDKLLVTGSQDRTAKLFMVEYEAASRASPQSTAKLVPLGIFKGHKRGVWSVRFSPTEKSLATASGDRTIKLWNITDFSCLKVRSLVLCASIDVDQEGGQTFEGHTNTVLRVDFLPSGAQLASCASDGLVKVWNVKDEDCVATLDNHEEKVCYR